MQSFRNIATTFVVAALCVGASWMGHAAVAHAQTASQDDLRAKIAENNRKIEDLQRQIDQYTSLYNSTSKEAQTLRNALNQLEITQKKLEASFALTSTQISKTSLTLEDLEEDIDAAEEGISSKEEAIAESMRSISQAESQSTIEQFLGSDSMSDAWDFVNGLRTLQGRVKVELTELRDLRMLLGAKRDQALGEKTKLEQYRKSLADQQKVVESNKLAKDQLLKETQNKEANYKAILDDKIAEKNQFEKELADYESRLKIIIDPNSIPSARPSTLAWPFASVYMSRCSAFQTYLGNKDCVTQYFGYTAAARKLYKTKSHGGMDFRASVGTPITAALSGTVTSTETTKSACQYGKYVLIKHPNGLSTVYGHLSVVSVQPGETVATGDVIGYSGDTGYVTGPHLHFGLYASDGIRIVDSGTFSGRSCRGISTIAATPAAYLDPLPYLPKL